MISFALVDWVLVVLYVIIFFSGVAFLYFSWELAYIKGRLSAFKEVSNILDGVMKRVSDREKMKKLRAKK